jgi:hypothetical protein
MALTPDDVIASAALSRRALEPLATEDGSVPAAELDWDVRTTMTHVCDAVGWYAAQLADCRTGPLRLDYRVHDGAANPDVLDVLGAAAATLAVVAQATPPAARGFHEMGMADAEGFPAMACDEILVHCGDAVRGLRNDFAAPDELAERIVRRLFPLAPTGGNAWQRLLWANGRANTPGEPHRPGPGWVWHCAPLDEWTGHDPNRR